MESAGSDGTTANTTASTAAPNSPAASSTVGPAVGSAEAPAHRYTASLAGEIERHWQAQWAERGTFHAPNPVGSLRPADGKVPEDKLFVQDMFPYPSGAGLHVGHPLGYIATDVYARYHRMLGANVLHALGYDAYGLPAEQYAVQTGQHPRITTEQNVANMQRQLGRLGLGHDPRRSFATTDVEFYRWTQWIFLQIFNSWFDPEAPVREHDSAAPTGRTGRARPIAELVAEFESGTRALPAERKAEFGNRGWAELSAAERETVLSDYRLVYLSDSIVNWCPGLGTVLANEEVTAEGKSERGNFPVFRKNLRQWMMRITAYSDRLIDDLEFLDWPEKVKSMQRNWIGRSRGAEVSFPLVGHDGAIEVFTTRPDTLFGATYMVLAPEHSLVDAICAQEWPADVDARWTGGEATPAAAIAAYRARIAAKSDLERQENKEKTGVFTGAYATNPLSGEQIPVFIADYVLTGYGTGAIMAVPAHDTRDFEFSAAFGLPRLQVVAPPAGEAGPGYDDTAAYVGDGTAINSSHGSLDINGLSQADAKDAVIKYLEAEGLGRGTIQYKLRDWLFARQRYWGEPFPIVYDAAGTAHALPEEMLPVELPEVDDYKPVSFDPEDADSEPSPPLAKAREWVEVELDLGDGLQTYTRDTNVMPQWAGSSWYELRYADPSNDKALVDPENEAYWLGPRPAEHGANDPGGVDLYVGGVEHAVLHLLYSRFWHKVMFDLGIVSSSEPYRRLFNQGYIQAYAYTDSRGVYVPAAEVVTRDGKHWWTNAEGVEIEVREEYGKMGKSLKNSVSPDEIAEDYGADTLRVYEMSMGPLDQSRPWATKDVVGAHRFLQRVWRVVVDEASGAVHVADVALDDDTARALAKTVDGVRADYAEMRDNTAIAKLIEFTNVLTKKFGSGGAPREAAEALVQMLAPVAPHIAEELWSRLGHAESLAHGPFPVADESLLVDESIEYPVQVKGKLRSRITVAADASPADVEAEALADEKIAAILAGAAPKKVIVVPGKMVNVVP